MKPLRGLKLIELADVACASTTEVPVEGTVVKAPDLNLDCPAQVLLDVRTGIPTGCVNLVPKSRVDQTLSIQLTFHVSGMRSARA